MIILPNLPYKKDELEPYISSKTLDYHYDKHHAGYVTNLNKFIQQTEFENMLLADIILATHSKDRHSSIFSNAAQVWNHTFYWNSLKKDFTEIHEELLEKINASFGSLEGFKEKFIAIATSQFGSGWAWLVLNIESDKLEMIKTSNAETPLVNRNYVPLLTVDVWEHAYYIDYQNQRPGYLKAVIDNLLNWDFAYNNLLAGKQLS